VNGLDHFKQCGHLAFWVRRLSPVVEFSDLDFGDSEMPVKPKEKALRDLLKGYVNEYLAFDFGYHLCRYYEARHKEKPSSRASRLALSPDYYQMISHFMKFKNVSPHAGAPSLQVAVLLQRHGSRSFIGRRGRASVVR
jgi:hypothetical protein